MKYRNGAVLVMAVLFTTAAGSVSFAATLNDKDKTAKAAFAVLADNDLKGVYLDVRNTNLRGAKLNGTNFAQTDLSGAIWSDGRVCGQGSLGSCN